MRVSWSSEASSNDCARRTCSRSISAVKWLFAASSLRPLVDAQPAQRVNLDGEPSLQDADVVDVDHPCEPLGALVELIVESCLPAVQRSHHLGEHSHELGELGLALGQVRLRRPEVGAAATDTFFDDRSCQGIGTAGQERRVFGQAASERGVSRDPQPSGAMSPRTREEVLREPAIDGAASGLAGGSAGATSGLDNPQLRSTCATCSSARELTPSMASDLADLIGRIVCKPSVAAAGAGHRVRKWRQKTGEPRWGQTLLRRSAGFYSV